VNVTRPHGIQQRLYRTGILLKGLNGAMELIGGILLAVIPQSGFTKAVLFLTQHDVGSGSKDWAFRELGHALSRLSGESGFAIFYLLSHGVLKLLLAIALLREARWAYPVALVTFGTLAGYEVYRFLARPGVMMAVIIAIDLGVIALIWSHWSAEKRTPRHAGKRGSHATA